MKVTSKAAFVNILFRTLVCFGCTCLTSISNSSGQMYQAGANTPVQRFGEQGFGDPQPDFALKVTVREVRIDAVVLDKKGRQVTDLAADDFRLYQDGKEQKITSCVYVNDYEGRSAPDPRFISRSRLPIDKIRRTIAFVVDDLSMSFEHLHYARTALQKFAESQMQPGDLVAILRTSRGVGAMQLFNSDKRELLAAIRGLRWTMEASGGGCGPGG